MAIRIVLSLDQVIALGIIALCILIGLIAYIKARITFEWFKERHERKKRERKENVE